MQKGFCVSSFGAYYLSVEDHGKSPPWQSSSYSSCLLSGLQWIYSLLHLLSLGFFLKNVFVTRLYNESEWSSGL